MSIVSRTLLAGAVAVVIAVLVTVVAVTHGDALPVVHEHDQVQLRSPGLPRQ
ncbi:hypothetical protein P8605_29700 [Streptomyces sp. T-3]|nr:hypothetical protein [Streptomyces sp. T-3]